MAGAGWLHAELERHGFLGGTPRRAPFRALRDSVLAVCPSRPDCGWPAVTRVLVRDANNMPTVVRRRGPVTVGADPHNDIVVPRSGPLHALLYSDDGDKDAGLVVVDVGTPYGTGVASAQWMNQQHLRDEGQWLRNDFEVVLTLSDAGDSSVRVEGMGRTPPLGIGPLDHGKWATLPPVLAYTKRHPIQCDAMASAYAHVHDCFVDRRADWRSPAARRLFRGLTLYFNPPWDNPPLTEVSHFCVFARNAAAYICGPRWHLRAWHQLLSRHPRVVLVKSWPKGTRGLFGAVAHNYQPVGYGIPCPVDLFFVRPRREL